MRNNRIVTYALAAVALLMTILVFVALPAGSGASPDLTPTPSATPPYRAHIPVVRHDPTPTPAATASCGRHCCVTNRYCAHAWPTCSSNW